MKSRPNYTVIVLVVLLAAVLAAMVIPVLAVIQDLRQMSQSLQAPSVPGISQPTAPSSGDLPTTSTSEPDVPVTLPSAPETEPTQPPTEPPAPTTEPTVPPTVPTEPVPCTHVYEAEVVIATCTEPGYTFYLCSLCGDSYADDFTELGDHSYSDWQIQKAPTCTEEGEEAIICIYCGDTQLRSLEATGHSYGDWETRINATCTVEGEEVSACTFCGDVQSRSLEAKGHSYGSWKTACEPTCTEQGIKERSCKRCDDVQSKSVDATGHTYDDGVITKEAATCADSGIKCYTCQTCGHQYEKTVLGDHTMVCDTCEKYDGDSYDSLHAPGYKTDYSHILACIYCDFGYTDKTYELLCNGLISEDSALFTDTIKLTIPEYTGALLTWSDRWHEFDTFTKMGIMYGSWSRKDGWEGSDYEYRVWDITSYEEAEAVLADYNEFVVEFEQVYKWKPVEVKMEYREDKQYVRLYYYDQDQYDTYRKQKKKLSDEEKAAVADEVIGYTLQKWGIRDGMNIANTLEYLYYMIWTDVAYYDQSLRFHSAYDGFATHTCVCDGYSEMFQLYAQALGIESEEVFGSMDGVGHAWNRVIFSDGTKWHIDITNGPVLKADEEIREYGYKWKD